MPSQNALFPDLEKRSPQPEPRGFRYEEDIVSEKEEDRLATSLGELDLKPFEFHGHLGNRRVLSFGLKYHYSRRAVERAGQRPAFLDDLLARVANFTGYPAEDFQQVGVNEYRPGAGIGWHKDKPQFGIVVGVSLLGSATLRFRKTQGENWKRVSHVIKPRSIYLLSAEARSEWEHSIPPLNKLRYSITFRTLSENQTSLP